MIFNTVKLTPTIRLLYVDIWRVKNTLIIIIIIIIIKLNKNTVNEPIVNEQSSV